MMNKRKDFKTIFSESIFSKGETYVKICLTILFAVIFIIIFTLNDGPLYFEMYPYASSFKNNSFQIHIIDVEDGDAILLKLPNNKTMMIDTGEEKYFNRVNSYLKQFCYLEKTDKIDYLILTHPDSDHIGNASSIIEKFNVKTVYRPKIYAEYEVKKNLNKESYTISDSLIYDKAIEMAYKEGSNLVFSENGLKISLSGCEIEFLSPKLNSYSQTNNYSAVIMLTFRNKKFLFTGDAESSIEQALIEEYGDKLKVDVLKVGHHGSKTSTSSQFLEYTSPQFALISAGGDSLPSSETLELLKYNDIKILSTYDLGSFAISLNQDDIVYHKAEKEDKNLPLYFTIFVMLTFIVWKNPFASLKKG